MVGGGGLETRSAELSDEGVDAVLGERAGVVVDAVSDRTGGVGHPEMGLFSGTGESRVSVFGGDGRVQVEVGLLVGVALGGVNGLGP
jgi:hypothetical protein